MTASPPDSDYPYNAKQPFNADEEALAALGYKSEFKREFSLFATCAVSFAILGLLPSFASTLFFSMGYAGTAGMAWGWPVAMIGIQCVAMSMAELCSSMPIPAEECTMLLPCWRLQHGHRLHHGLRAGVTGWCRLRALLLASKHTYFELWEKKKKKG